MLDLVARAGKLDPAAHEEVMKTVKDVANKLDSYLKTIDKTKVLESNVLLLESGRSPSNMKPFKVNEAMSELESEYATCDFVG